MAAAAKKKPGKGGKKDAGDDEKKEDDKPKGPPPKVELDLNKPHDFQEALNERAGRPFIFGPVEFHGLDEPETFEGEHWRHLIEEQLAASVYLPENLCIHGFNVTIKNKTLKRATTVVKHSRFLRNMVVYPRMPAVQVHHEVVHEKNHADEEANNAE